MYQLVSGQIDVDRLDYLKRDSFFTGVTEGSINTDRIIAMMSVENENLVFEKKGLYSIEKFLLARRLMYWQVYLHKTSLVAELILIKIFKRFRSLVLEKNEIIKSSHILYHLIHANRDYLVAKKWEVIPLEFIVRAYITGSTNTSLWTHYKKGVRNYCGVDFPDGLVKNQKLKEHVLTPTTKGEVDELPLIKFSVPA